jgi:superfamily II DNA or RNA helicase
MVVTIHALYDSTFPNSLLVFGECSKLEEALKRKGRRSKNKAALHPNVIFHDTLFTFFSHMRDQTDELFACEEELLFPTFNDEPVSMAEIGTIGVSTMCLQKWRIFAYLYPLKYFVQDLPYLIKIPRVSEFPDHEDIAGTYALSQSFEYWLHVSAFCLKEITLERFLPCIEQVDESNVRSSWVLVQEQHVTERFNAISQAMPPLCLHATSDDPTSIYEIKNTVSRANDLLISYVSAFITSCIDKGKTSTTPKLELNHSVLMSQHIQLIFIMHLTGTPDFLQIDSALPVYHDITQSLMTWCRSSPFGSEEIAFCMHIAIEEPTTPDGMWRLSYYLSPTKKENSYQISADKIWDGCLDEFPGLPPAFHLEEVLMREIGRAVSIYPFLASSLMVLDPTHVDLTIEEFALFFDIYANQLIEAGIFVDIPLWWKEKPIKPKIRVSLAQSVAGPRCGLETLMDYHYAITFEDEEITLDDFMSRNEMQFTYLPNKGCWQLIDLGRIQTVINALKARGKHISPREIISLAAIDEQAVEFESEEEWCSHFLKAAFTQGSTVSHPVPESFHGVLRHYQEVGLSFMLNSLELGYGVCLADDMGLGKTPQAIAYLLARKEMNPEDTPVLIICPTSVAGNWEREIERFGPSLKVYVHHGTDREKAEGFTEALSLVDLVITTYALAGRDFSLFSSVHWSSIILDEAQNIKNHRTRQAKAVHSLSADHRIALTGTPIENRLSELWSIMQFLNKGYLSAGERFKDMYAIPIERNNDTEKAEELRRLIRPFMLRRVKTDPTIISDLPDKIETKVYCTLTQEQASLYQSVVSSVAETIKEAGGIERRGIILSSLTKLKEICDHPSLYLHEWEYKVARSGKVQRLVEMLEEVIESGEAAIVFTQYATFAIELRLVLEEFLEEKVILLTGQTHRKRREELIAEFMHPDGPKIFILSLKAGGVGLNLTRANHVFHVDRWWNPAVENQATDRAFRIGQTKDVVVHLMIAAGTLEERIDSMLEEKRFLADQILGGGDDWLMSLSNDELLNVISLRESVFEE